MPSNKNFLDNIRKKPESHKNVIAAVFALLPALLVGYGQFYMNANTPKEDSASNGIAKDINVNEVSALASIGKIFSESKASISDAVVNLKKIDKEILMNEAGDNIDIIQNGTNTTTSTSAVIDDTNILKATE
jgi:hypothetical protein